MQAGYQIGQPVKAAGDFEVAGDLEVNGQLATPEITRGEDGLTIHTVPVGLAARSGTGLVSIEGALELSDYFMVNAGVFQVLRWRRSLERTPRSTVRTILSSACRSSSQDRCWPRR